MRELTLDEKISIRGILVDRGCVASRFIKGNIQVYVFNWYLVLPGPISEYYKPRNRIRHFKHRRRN